MTRARVYVSCAAARLAALRHARVILGLMPLQLETAAPNLTTLII